MQTRFKENKKLFDVNTLNEPSKIQKRERRCNRITSCERQSREKNQDASPDRVDSRKSLQRERNRSTGG